MVNAWVMCDDPSDQRQQNHTNPPRFLSLEDLKPLGISYRKLDATNYEADLKEFREANGYSYSDEVECSPAKLDNYEAKLKMFYTEHLHTDDEVRFVVAGSGYFDVRSLEDFWIRILVEPGDLLIVPAGIYHRFTLDTNEYIHAIRLFCGVPVWTPYDRPADSLPARVDYLAKVTGSAH